MKSMIRDMGGDASFEAPKYLPNIENWTTTEIVPDSQLDNITTTHKFTLSTPQDSKFVKLDSIRLCGKFKIVKHDGSSACVTEAKEVNGAITPAIFPANAAPVNNLPHSMFKNVEVRIGGTPITGNGNGYMYIAFLHINYLLTKAMKDFLKEQLYLTDVDTDKKYASQAELGNPFKERNKWINDDEKPFLIQPYIDLMYGNCGYITPGTKFEIYFKQNDANTVIQIPTGNAANLRLKIRITELKLRMQQIVLHFPAQEIIDHYYFKIQTYQFPFTRFHQMEINSGIRTITISNIAANASSKIPTKLWIFMTTNEQLSSVEYDPLHFGRFDLEEYQLTKNSLPCPAFPVCPEDEQLISYFWFREQMGYDLSNAVIGPKMSDYFSNQFIMAWDLKGDQCAGTKGIKNIHQLF